MTDPDHSDATDPAAAKETIPNPDTGVGIGADVDAEPNTFEPEEDSEPDPS